MILLDPKKNMPFIADVTNTRNKEYFMNVTKASITSKTILTDTKLETAKLDMAIHSVE